MMEEKKIWRWYRKHKEAVNLTLEFAKTAVPGVGIVVGGLQMVLARINDKKAVDDEAKQEEMERVLEEIKPIVSEVVEEIEDNPKFASIRNLEEGERLREGQKIIGEDASIHKELEKIMPQLSQSLVMSIGRMEKKTVIIVAGRYELIERIGRGGQGEVWKAKHLLAETIVAIKFLPEELSQDDNAIAAVREEYKRVTQLIHPNIVQYREFDYDGESKRYFLVMDYIAGTTLRVLLLRLRAAPMPFEDALLALEPIEAALAFAHERKIVHCDLKPENILVRENDGSWLLTDFGLAKEIRHSLSLRSMKVDISGTMPYMAPEQYKGRPATAETDTWALGIILYEMVAGYHPFYGTSFEHYKDLICNEEPEQPENIADNEWIILQKMLAKEKRERIVSFDKAKSVKINNAATKNSKENETTEIAEETRKLREQNSLLEEQIATEKEAIAKKKKEEEEKQKLAEELQKAREKQAKLAEEKRKIAKMAKRSENRPEQIPLELWGNCWCEDHFDFTTPIWAALSTIKQAEYAKVYQNWYGQQYKMKIEQNFVVDKFVDEKIFLGLSKRSIHIKTKICVMLIPPGKFWMGSPEMEKDRNGDEKRHVVLLPKPFYFAKTPTTQQEWQDVMGNNPSCFKESGLNAPVENVNHTKCIAFCQKIGARLPTEAEWEYVCRAGTQAIHYGELDEIAWYHSNSQNKTHPVGEKLANAWGSYDMLGNVWEWCSDWYGDYDILVSEKGSVITDPKGVITGSARVRRGGSWILNPAWLRAAFRIGGAPEAASNFLGFRCVFEAF